jgi:hypothetical protein
VIDEDCISDEGRMNELIRSLVKSSLSSCELKGIVSACALMLSMIRSPLLVQSSLHLKTAEELNILIYD